MLGHGAADDVLVRAAAMNQTTWMTRTAEAVNGFVQRERGVTWMASVAGAVLAFPRVSMSRLADLLPQFLDAARRESSREVSCWSLLPTSPPALAEMLHAVGFRDGWQAQWMAVDLTSSSGSAVPDVEIGLSSEAWTATDLPWDGAGIAMVRRRLAGARPRHVWHLGAWRGGEAIGHALLNVTTGALGVAGIYDMGVAAAEQRRGVGRALTLAALDLARARGCSVATLNATEEGKQLYRTLGFRSVGVAQTWWLDVPPS